MMRLLVIDDERSILTFFRTILSESGYEIVVASSATEGLQRFGEVHPDVVVTDLAMPDGNGLDLFRRLQLTAPETPVIVMTGSGTTRTAIEAMSLGAFEYLLKPLNTKRMLEVIRLAFLTSEASKTLAKQPPPDSSAELFIGSCEAMQEVYKSIGRIAPHNATVLILGESGTGKELVAQAIHRYSPRNEKPFIAINCAAIPEALLESELFGHEKGAFTGADRLRIGKFEAAHEGTLFLDEVGEMTPSMQAKLLRALQEQDFHRVGGDKTIRCDVRVIAATNRNLEERVQSGQFRADLYYRLRVFVIRVPPLREREGDMRLLIDHFVLRFRHETGSRAHALRPEAMELFERYSWPGNLRELQSVLRQGMLRSVGPIVGPEVFADLLSGGELAETRVEPGLKNFIRQRIEVGTQELYEEWLKPRESEFLRSIMEEFHGNLSQAARSLGIHRMTLRSKLQAHGIEDDKVTR